MKNPARLSLARLPTPIQRLNKTSERVGKEIYLWRDDLTGFLESGNKVRKLEFLMADALAKGCDWIITCGGPQSNHTRATAVIARQLGLGVSILTLPKPGFDRTKTPSGNLLINNIFDSNMVWMDFDEFKKNNSSYDLFLEREAIEQKSRGKKPYIIPLGGSNPIGCLGYWNALGEIGSFVPDDLFCAMGSGGTFVGLQLGIQERKLKTRLHGVNVIGPMETAVNYVSTLCDAVVKHYGVEPVRKNMNLLDGYAGEGYAIASDADLEFYIQFARDEGILLDPCYTGKAFRGMLAEITKNPPGFGGKILFLHSGGLFGNFAYAEQFQHVLKK